MASCSITDWIIAVATCIGALSVLYAARQATLLKEQISADHERSRRQVAVDLIWRFTELMSGTAATDFVEGLATEVVRSIVNCESTVVRIDERQQNALRVCLKGTSLVVPQIGEVTLSRDIVGTVQTDALRYLSIVESVLLAWLHNVADRKMIEDQLAYLFDATKGRNCLKAFRAAAGGARIFPATAAFELELAKRVEDRLEGRSPIGVAV